MASKDLTTVTQTTWTTSDTLVASEIRLILLQAGTTSIALRPVGAGTHQFTDDDTDIETAASITNGVPLDNNVWTTLDLGGPSGSDSGVVTQLAVFSTGTPTLNIRTVAPTNGVR